MYGGRSVGEYLGGMVFGLDLLGGDYAGHFARGRDNECGAECAHIFAPVH